MLFHEKTIFFPDFWGRCIQSCFQVIHLARLSNFHTLNGLCLAMCCFYYYYFLRQADSYKEELMRVGGEIPLGKEAGKLKLIKHDSFLMGALFV